MFSARFTVKGDIGTGNVTVKPREAEKDGDKVLHLATFSVSHDFTESATGIRLLMCLAGDHYFFRS